MRTLTIVLVIAFVFLFAQQLTASPPGLDREGSGASQAVVAGVIGCFPDRELNQVKIAIETGLGVIGISSDENLTVAGTLVSEECLDLILALAEQVPDRVCEIGIAPGASAPSVEAFGFVCTGRADVVISAIGKMAKAVPRLGHL